MARLRLFAALREAAGVDEVEIEATTLDDLLQKATLRYGPEFARRLDQASIVINGSAASRAGGGQTRLDSEDEVALLPPVSGGARSRGKRSVGKPRGNRLRPLAVTLATGLTSILAATVAPVQILTAVFSAVSGLAAFQISRRVSGSAARPTGLFVAGTATAFPLAALLAGEEGLLGTCGAAMIVLAALALSLRPAKPLVSAATSMWIVIYCGFLAAYPILIRATSPGRELLSALLLMVLGYRLAVAQVLPPNDEPDTSQGMFKQWPSALMGAAATLAAAMVSLSFLNPPFTAGPVLVLGTGVALFSILGDAASRLLRTGYASQNTQVTNAAAILLLEPLLFAAPAFYYGMKLYLT